MKRHSFSHGELKPFKCKKCGKRFSENNKLFNHLVTHEKKKSSKALSKVKLKRPDETRVEPIAVLESLLAMKTSSEVGTKNQPAVSSLQSSTPSDQQLMSREQQGVEVSKNLARLDGAVSSSQASADCPRQELNMAKNSGVNDMVMTSKTSQNIVNFATGINDQNPHGTLRSRVGDLYPTPTDHAEQSPDMPVLFTKRDIIQSNSDKLKMLVENAIGRAGDENQEAADGGKTFADVLTSGGDISGAVNASSSKQQTITYANGSFQESLAQGTKSANRLHSCDICLESFLTAIDVRQHKIVDHASSVGAPQQVEANELKYKCTECGKGFKTPSKLKRHHLSHTGETPFHCELCPKQFKRKDSLRKHIEEHNRGK